jgi:hypothetical protein
LGVDKTVLFECFITALLLFPIIVVDDAVVMLFEGANENDALLVAVGGWVFVGANENNVLAGVGGAATVLVVAEDDDDVNENVGLGGRAVDAAAAVVEDCAAKEMLANGFGLAGGSSCGADVDDAAGGARLANKGFDEDVGATDAATADPADPADPAPLPKPNDLRETLIILRR